MLQASMFNGLSLDGFALFDDGWRPVEVGVSGRHVLQALVIALVVVMLDEGLDLEFEVAGLATQILHLAADRGASGVARF